MYNIHMKLYIIHLKVWIMHFKVYKHYTLYTSKLRLYAST